MQKIAVKPNLCDLSFAQGTFPTPYGVLKVRAQKEGDRTAVFVDAPDGVSVVTK